MVEPAVVPWAAILAVAEVPAAWGAYQRWLVSSPRRAARDYLFLDERPRFEPRRGDVVVPAEGLTVEEVDGAAALVVEGTRLPVPGVAPEVARRLVGAMDGRMLVEVGWEGEGDALARLLRGGFGRVLFAPEAVSALEARCPSVEVQRFVSSPYAVERAYWGNVASVRAAVEHLDTADEARFWTALRGLHVVLLLGADLESFYRPASPIADEGVAPGRLLRTHPRVVEGATGAVYLDGPRVNARLLPHEAVARAIFESVADPAASEAPDVPGWGRVVAMRGERDAAVGPWFLPPRPIEREHLAAIHDAWRRARAAPDPSDALADLHWAFVRLHPFRAGNQSLVMALVHACLDAGFPHLLLDSWALRLRREPYREVFRRARAIWTGEGEGASRLAQLRRRRQSFDAAVAAMAAGRELSPDERRAVLLDGTAVGDADRNCRLKN